MFYLRFAIWAVGSGYGFFWGCGFFWKERAGQEFAERQFEGLIPGRGQGALMPPRLSTILDETKRR